MQKLFFLTIFLLCSLLINAQLDSFLIDFEDYTVTSNLHGQDGWVSIDQTAGGQDQFIDINAHNGTNAAFYTGNGPGYGRTITRKEFGDLSFDFSNGGKLEIEWDMQANWWGQWLAIGFDRDGDGHLAHNLDPTEENSAAVILNMSKAGQNYKLTSGSNATNFTPPPTGDDYQFVRYRLLLDLSANDGEGKAALFYKGGNFSGDWLAVPELQGLDLGLTPGSGDFLDPATWDAFSFHAQGSQSILDNLIFRTEPDDGLASQFIDFEQIGKQLTTNAPFELVATATSGLPVSFEIVSGPASLNGNTLTLDGNEGTIELRAIQAGDGSAWAPADPVIQIFQVIDPALYFPSLIVRNPVDQKTVIMPELTSFLMTASTFIEHEDVLAIEGVNFSINGETLPGKNWGTGYYTTYWTPPAYGSYTLTVTSQSSEGPVTTEIVNFEVIDAAEDMTITLIDGLRAGVADTNLLFPSFVGGFENVKLILEYNCPTDGCEPWDRINQQEAQGPTGEWFGFMRYITPYGVACSDEQDITDYMSLFQGIVRMHLPYEWRSIITIRLEYTAGTPAYKYSWVDKVWENHGGFAFGNPENLQTVPIRNFDLSAGLEDAKLTVINSGHNWGDNNSNNAAEFSENTHNININGSTVYTHTPWENCNPNPADCSPQNGTWFFDRAGWCPGTLVPVEGFSLQNYIGSAVELQYELDPSYTDFCHPNNPNCVSGTTCPDCDAPFSPVLVMDAHLITFSNQPLENTITVVEEPLEQLSIKVSPNPSDGMFTIFTKSDFRKASVQVYNSLGQAVFSSYWNSAFENSKVLDLSRFTKGVYWLNIRTVDGFGSQKIIIQ